MLNYNVYKSYGEKNFAGLEPLRQVGYGGGRRRSASARWFVGYITNKDNPLAFVVIVENGGPAAKRRRRSE